MTKSNTDNLPAAIDALTRALAYTQEITKLGKHDPSDLASPEVPIYGYKKQMIEGKLRQVIENKLEELVQGL